MLARLFTALCHDSLNLMAKMKGGSNIFHGNPVTSNYKRILMNIQYRYTTKYVCYFLFFLLPFLKIIYNKINIS